MLEERRGDLAQNDFGSQLERLALGGEKRKVVASECTAAGGPPMGKTT